MEFMRSWITNITVVIIFAMLLEMLIPKGDLKRFAKVIMGLLIILVITKPFLMIKDMGNQFQATMAQTAALIESAGYDNGESLEAFQNNAALNIFKQKISDKVIEIVKSREGFENSQVSVNVSIENNINKEDFGSIKSIEVFVEKGKKGTVQASAIEPVKINKENVINKKQEEYKWNNSKISQDLRSEINEVLGLKETDITIEIHE